MTSRTGRRLAAVVALSLCAALAACGGGSVPPPPDSFGTPADFAVPANIANLPLTKADGTTTTLAAYKGKTVMIADFLTLCSDICPMISANTAALARSLDANGQASNVALLEITVDPQRDTPKRLRAYEKLFDAPSNWTLLTASPTDLKTLWKYFGVAYHRVKEGSPPDIDWLTHKPLTYDVGHLDALIFLDADGHERYVVNSEPDAQGNVLPASLQNSLSAEGKRALKHPNPVTDWTVPQGLSVFSWLLNTKLTQTS